MAGSSKPPEDRSSEIREKATMQESVRVNMTKRMLESGYKDYRERKDFEESTKKREDYEQVIKF
jgi:hypothetical protein